MYAGKLVYPYVSLVDSFCDAIQINLYRLLHINEISIISVCFNRLFLSMSIIVYPDNCNPQQFLFEELGSTENIDYNVKLVISYKFRITRICNCIVLHKGYNIPLKIR